MVLELWIPSVGSKMSFLEHWTLIRAINWTVKHMGMIFGALKSWDAGVYKFYQETSKGGLRGGLSWFEIWSLKRKILHFSPKIDMCAVPAPLEPPWCCEKKVMNIFQKISQYCQGGCKGGLPDSKNRFFAKKIASEVTIQPNLSPPCSPPGNGYHIRILWGKPSLKHIYNFSWKCIGAAVQLQGRETD